MFFFYLCLGFLFIFGLYVCCLIHAMFSKVYVWIVFLCVGLVFHGGYYEWWFSEIRGEGGLGGFMGWLVFLCVCALTVCG